MAARMTKTVDLGFGSIKVDCSLTADQLHKKARRMSPDDNNPDQTVGLWYFDGMTIYIAKDLRRRMQYRLLIHEISEAIVEMAELRPYSHKTVLLLENLLAALLMNKKMIQAYWRSQDAASD